MIPVNEPWLGERENELVLDALKSGWISGSGAYIERFEKEWAGICERRHGISMCTGTAALEAAVHTLRLPAGSEVIMPTFTLIACFAALVRNHLKPVFVDADPVTWCMDVEKVAELITPETSAIMAVHIYGHPVDMDPLLALAERHGLKVIEDAAEAHGGKYKGSICGSFGDVSIFSFYGNKIVTTGEGGMALCDDDKMAEDCRRYRNLAYGKSNRFKHDEIGQNYRFSNLQAALGCAQVEKFQEALQRKRSMANAYREELEGLPDVQLPADGDSVENVYWVYGVVVGDSYSLDALEVRKRLEERGVGTRAFFLGMHEQPAVHEAGFGKTDSHPVSERLSRRGFYLPSGLTLTDEMIRTSARALRSVLGH